MRVPGYELSLGAEVAPRACESDETTASPTWTLDWLELLLDAINEHDAWGVVIQRPNMDVLLYDVSIDSLERAVCGGGVAWLVVGREIR